jgi:hypothetical protein
VVLSFAKGSVPLRMMCRQQDRTIHWIAFLKDLAYTRFLGIRGLPACLIQCGEQSALVSGMIGFNGFVTVIEQLQLRNQACNEGDGR